MFSSTFLGISLRPNHVRIFIQRIHEMNIDSFSCFHSKTTAISTNFQTILPTFGSNSLRKFEKSFDTPSPQKIRRIGGSQPGPGLGRRGRRRPRWPPGRHALPRRGPRRPAPRPARRRPAGVARGVRRRGVAVLVRIAKRSQTM